HLPLDIAGVNRLSGVLDGCEPKYRHLAGLRIQFYIHDISRKRAPDSPRVDGRAAHKRTAGRAQLSRQLAKRELQLRLALGPKHTGFRLDRLHVYFPDARGALAHLTDDVASCLHGWH